LATVIGGGCTSRPGTWSAFFQPALLAAAHPAPRDRILDVGCGSGQLAIDLVRTAPAARALGVDLSSAQLDVARRRGAGLAVEFEQADAQVHDFGTAAFDLIVSRTGTMFFGHAVAAFANLASAARQGGRLAILVWSCLAENEWLREMFKALRVGRDLPMPPPGAPGPFAQSDPTVVEPLLADAGWSDVAFEPLDQSIWLGRDADRGTRWQLGQSAWLLLDTRRSAPRPSRTSTHTLHRPPDARRRRTGLGGLADHRPPDTLSGSLARLPAGSHSSSVMACCGCDRSGSGRASD